MEVFVGFAEMSLLSEMHLVFVAGMCSWDREAYTDPDGRPTVFNSQPTRRTWLASGLSLRPHT
jgi:hypothetical protein